MSVVEYVLPLSENARKRHWHKTLSGKVAGFVVQLEVLVGNEWKPVVRYDCAHGFAHLDLYNLKGYKKKIKIAKGLGEVLTIADEDIKENWVSYRDNFLKGD